MAFLSNETAVLTLETLGHVFHVKLQTGTRQTAKFVCAVIFVKKYEKILLSVAMRHKD